MGITPAYAGKRLTELFGPAGIGDHPRVCGEKSWSTTQSTLMLGSPPRMRGKANQPPRRRTGAGITPAYAGKSPLLARHLYGAGDHPRVCGEKHEKQRMAGKNEGSPPRMRGKVGTRTWITRQSRITPAYAGKSPPTPLGSRTPRDHPRVCGEKYCIFFCSLCQGGSPPRMRGKGKRSDGAGKRRRITPAYAGKSGPCPDRGPPAGDHPRVCGEKLQLYAT